MSDNKGLHKGVAKANICNHTDDIYECFCGKEYATYHNFWYEKIFDNVYDLESNVKAEQKYHNQICNVKDGVE